MHSGNIIVGYCRLRKKHISDTTIGNNLCKDKAVIDIDPAKVKKQEELRLADLSAKAWSAKRNEESTSNAVATAKANDSHANDAVPETNVTDKIEKKRDPEEEIIRKAVWR